MRPPYLPPELISLFILPMLYSSRIVLHIMTMLVGEEDLGWMLNTLLLGLLLGCNNLFDIAFVSATSRTGKDMITFANGFSFLVLEVRGHLGDTLG
ncbi:hypothetical protein B0I37DRAFT_375715 [Chaetomium sp. MPI-CAGE-AT-0009]|nr:hypothetical protein B0I37DRAFT_375715 [Chaetomium sp. MPI-CAGE-AT-0009]